MRDARAQWRRLRAHGEALLDPWGRPESEKACTYTSEWDYDGRGYRSPAEAELAALIGEQRRAERRAVWEQRRAAGEDQGARWAGTGDTNGPEANPPLGGAADGNGVDGGDEGGTR